MGKNDKKGVQVDRPFADVYQGLTLKQSLFVKFYLIHKNATLAAKQAGYKPTSANVTGFAVLKNKLVSDTIKKGLEEQIAKEVKEQSIDKEYVLTKAVEVLEACMQENDRPNALKALDIIGKHIDVNAFNREKEASITHNIVNNILPAADFRHFIEKTGILNIDFLNSDEKILSIADGSIQDEVENKEYIDTDLL